MNKQTVILLVILVALLVLACLFVPGFAQMMLLRLECVIGGYECVRIVQ